MCTALTKSKQEISFKKLVGLILRWITLVYVSAIRVRLTASALVYSIIIDVQKNMAAVAR